MKLKPLTHACRGRLVHALLLAVTWPQVVWAQSGLPSVGTPAGSGTGSGLIDTIRGYAGMAAILVGLLLATSAFLVVGGGAMGKFNEARKKGEWGEFAVVLVVGVLLIVAVLWLANEAATIL